jgi:seryl-tRNA synthetase
MIVVTKQTSGVKMIDIDNVRANTGAVVAALARRGFVFDAARFTTLDAERKKAQISSEALASQQKKIAEQIAAAKRASQPIEDMVAQGEAIRREFADADAAYEAAVAAMTTMLESVPNLPLDTVPPGASDADNVLLRQVGVPAKFDFSVRTHDEIGVNLDGLDFETATAMSGSRFSVVKGGIARLHRALIQFMLDTHVDEHNYREVEVPYLVRKNALYGTGQLPKFEEDLFRLERDDMYLIPTAEVPVTNLVANKILPLDALPLAFVARTPCFRREAGAAGRDVKGLIRQHQFEKVELVRICAPDQVAAQFDLLLGHAEAILQKLGLPYKVMQLCAGDMGFSSERTVDLEVWMPGQNAWREISSVSRFGDFQGRRMNARFRDVDGKGKSKNRPVCTLNGSGLAAGRTLAAVLENYQLADGTVRVPEVLRPYLKGATVIAA